MPSSASRPATARRSSTTSPCHYDGDENYAGTTPETAVFADAQVLVGGQFATTRRTVQRLYFDLLDRRPDNAGYDYWQPIVQGGGVADAAWAFALSDERFGNEIDDAYISVLGRPADDGGKAYYQGQFRKGLTYQGLLAILAGSPEFNDAVGADNGDAVDALYEAILFRAPDAGGRAYYTGLLDAKKTTRSGVALELARSTEAVHFVVEDLYSSVLLRDADQPGLDYWTTQIRGGYRQELVAYSMTRSAEWANAYK